METASCKGGKAGLFQVRVYYEDTDAGGVVYYANYLKFAERARTEFLRALGTDHGRLIKENGLLFAVKRIEADYLAPARLDDLLDISTEVSGCRAAALEMKQTISNGGKSLVKITATLVSVSPSGKVVRLPKALRAMLQ